MHRAAQVVTNPNYGISRLVTIAPAPNKKNMTLELTGAEGPKKYNHRSNPYCGAQAASIARRNARERNRVKQVNDSFNALRRRLPAAVVAALSNGSRRGSGKKLSKVDTLRMVVEYIRHMEDLLKENDEALGYQQSENITSVDTTQMWNNHEEIDEGFICGSTSPYSESMPSPDSDCSSGVSVYSSSVNYFGGSYQPVMEEQLSPMEENLYDTMSLWQYK